MQNIYIFNLTKIKAQITPPRRFACEGGVGGGSDDSDREVAVVGNFVLISIGGA